MAIGATWSRLWSLIAGAAIGGAAGDSIAPVLEAVKQHANAQRAIRVLDPATGARVAAERLATPVDVQDDAKRHGLGVARFNALVDLESTAPGAPEAILLWRRGDITREQAVKALHKAGLLEEYVEPMLALFVDRLDVAAVATAVQRGILPNANLLPVGPPTAVGVVPPMPTVNLDPVAEAAASGYDFDRLAVHARIIGLPPAPGELLELVNRGVIEEVDYFRGVAEGNTRNEWAKFLLELRRRLLTPHEYAELRLRGWIDDDAMYAGAALTGLSHDDTSLLELMLGRPLSWHQVFIGLRRGGVYGGPTDQIDPAFLKALEESDIRPEWYNLTWAQRYTYPSAFVLRALTAAGELTVDEAERILLYIGWEPELAHKVPARWAGGSSSNSWNETRTELADEYEGGYLSEQDYRDALTAHGLAGAAVDHAVHLGDARRNKRWREKIIDAIGAAYVAFKIDDTTATSELAGVHVLADTAGRLLALWQLERRDRIALLTPTQIKTGFKHGLIAEDVALAELEHRGYSPTDATTLIHE